MAQEAQCRRSHASQCRAWQEVELCRRCDGELYSRYAAVYSAARENEGAAGPPRSSPSHVFSCLPFMLWLQDNWLPDALNKGSAGPGRAGEDSRAHSVPLYLFVFEINHEKIVYSLV